jgi:hypothetical protein
MPDSEASAGLQVATDYLMWLFVFDDAYCDEGTHSDQPGAMMDLALQLARVVEMPGPDPAKDSHGPGARDRRGPRTGRRGREIE